MKSKLLILPILILFCTDFILAQSDLDIYGFYQVRLDNDRGRINVNGTIDENIANMLQIPASRRKVSSERKEDYITPYMQQLNLLFRKELNSSFTAFVNLEFLNNFSTERLWGDLNIDEAWLNYEHNPLLNVKAGLFIPKFGNLSEVKNRMPMLPYIVRPLIYETTLKYVISISDYLPERAFLQVYGNQYFDNLGLNYALYAGQSETSYLTSNHVAIPGEVLSGIPGTDTSKFKLFGGRLGMTYDDLRFGVSGTIDRDNQVLTTYQYNGLGLITGVSSIREDMKRYRLGFDLGFNYKNLFIDAELIKVMLDSKNTTEDIDKIFYYTTLEYDFSQEFYAYASYNYLEDKQNTLIKEGLNGFLIGGGYRATNALVIKLQFADFTSKKGNTLFIPVELVPGQPMLPVNADAKISIRNVSIAASILF